MSKVKAGTKPKRKLDRPINIEKKVISLDTSPESIAKWDLEGIIFEFDFEEFLDLSDEMVAALGHINKRNYFVAKTIADKLKEQEKEREEGERGPVGELEVVGAKKDKLEFNLIGGTATAKTQVTGGRKETHYCLKLPEQLSESLDAGYSFVDSSDPVKTPGMTKVAGTRRISSHGEDELILMKIPEKRYQEHIHAVSELSKGAREESRDGFKKEGAKLKKKYHLEYSDQSRIVRDNT